MEKTIDKKPERGKLKPMLKAMNVGDVIRYPIEMHTSLRAMVYVNMPVERADGCRWTVRPDFEARQSIVTRVS